MSSITQSKAFASQFSGTRQTPELCSIKYAQCWEDADILLSALDIDRASRVLSVASAGDNTLALLTLSPSKVVAIDCNPAQLACLELRMAAFRELTYEETLTFLGAIAETKSGVSLRNDLYARCRPHLSDWSKRFWDQRRDSIGKGIATQGRFENYFRLFRQRVLPFVHQTKTIEALLTPKSTSQRCEFFARTWNSFSWRVMFKLFFSNTVMAALGRDPKCFAFADKSLSEHVAARVEHALTVQNCASNPYLHWILKGEYTDALPVYLRAENFETIKANLDRVELVCAPLQDYLWMSKDNSFDCFNLSDIFEYMDETVCKELFAEISRCGVRGGRIAYWNMLVPRQAPIGQFVRLDDLSDKLYGEDKAFFYSNFHAEVIR